MIPLNLADHIFYQSVALPPLAAPAQTWKPTTATLDTLGSNAAAASAQIHLGSLWLVSLMLPLGQDSGSLHFVLHKAVPARVSGEEKTFKLFLFLWDIGIPGDQYMPYCRIHP